MKTPLGQWPTSRAASRSDSRGTRHEAVHAACPRSSPAPNNTFGVTASGGASGNPVTFASSTASICTVSNNASGPGSGNGAGPGLGAGTVTVLRAGTCTIAANQAGNAQYTAPIAVGQTVVINKADQTISFDPLPDRPQTPNTFTVAATATSNLAVTFQSQTTAKCTVSGTTVTMIATGTCTIRARQTGNVSYNAAPNVDKTMGEAPFTVTATASSGLAVAFTSATPTTCTATGTNGATITLTAPGTCTINANQAGNASYLPAPQVARSFTINAQAQVYFIHPDHLGTPRAITKATDNTKVWEWRNDEPFGDNQPNESPSGQGSFTYNLRFPGQYFDQETGTHYNYFRDYDPTIGRYIESDPIGLDAGINTYLYVGAGPLMWIDPLGLNKKKSKKIDFGVFCYCERPDAPNGTPGKWGGSYVNGVKQCAYQCTCNCPGSKETFKSPVIIVPGIIGGPDGQICWGERENYELKSMDYWKFYVPATNLPGIQTQFPGLAQELNKLKDKCKCVSN